jgi:hypothetical protein
VTDQAQGTWLHQRARERSLQRPACLQVDVRSWTDRVYGRDGVGCAPEARGDHFLEVRPIDVDLDQIIPMGAERAYMGARSLGPLTLELYCPEGEMTSVLHDEDPPDISARGVRQDSQLNITGPFTVRGGP